MVDRILMIVSDTVRWDMLGYNGGKVRTPNLDRLAARSMVFDRYYASSFPTVPTGRRRCAATPCPRAMSS